MSATTAIRSLLKTRDAVKLVFSMFSTYIISDNKKIEVSTIGTEEETIKTLNQEFRVYYSANSSPSERIFNVRPA